MGIIFSYLGSSIEETYKHGCGVDTFSSIDKTVVSLIFQPPPTLKENFNRIPGRIAIRDVDSSLVVSAFIIRCVLNSDKWVILSHGNAADIYTFYDYCNYFSTTYGVNVICYDYPGYGLTRGLNFDDNIEPSEYSCCKAHTVVVNYVIDTLKVNKKNIYLMGQSLGTGVVVDYVATNDWPTPIILVSPYKSLPRVILDSFCTDSLVSKHGFKSIDKISKLNCPVKIFHGLLDPFIVVQHGIDLYDNLRDKRLSMTIIDDADHNNIMGKIKEEDMMKVFNL
ncbi:MAG: alpha/beta hydrolase family protein [Terrestrivirus sp.]|uniref:Alpha/beta hydrolase family protein n=1 Tax=Terrestrivirus sp. TaxID=2487775 RepID=A0A3G4ZQW4_9VIRU|nr:MAG: alpha/beta hydrolase family protein [Terrestrivirus sp.]